MARLRKQDDDAEPKGAVWSSHQRRRVLQARDPAWLREYAAQCRAVLAGHGRKAEAPIALRLTYLHLRDPAWLLAHAQRCEDRASALEREEAVPDWWVADDYRG